MSEPRQIIIEMSGDGKNIILRKDEFASIFERSAVLQAVVQTPDLPIVPLAGEKPMPDALRNNQSNKNENGKSRPTTGGNSNGNKRCKNPKQ